MDMRTALPVAVLAMLAAGTASAQDWQQGPLGNRRDLTPSAVSKGQLASGDRLVSDAAYVFMACKKADQGPATLELRFSSPLYPGYTPATVSPSGSIAIDGASQPTPVISIPLQNRAFFITSPDPATARKIATVGHDGSATLVFGFTSSGQKMDFVTTLGEPNQPVAAVLEACGITVAKASPAVVPTAASASVQGKYAIEGVRLGMTRAQVQAALKVAGSTRGLVDTRTGTPMAQTRDVIFPDIQFNDIGQVWSFHFKALSRLKGTKNSGPTYDMAVKAFGPPTSVEDGKPMWGRGEKVGVETASYEWDRDELPGGDVWVGNGLQTVKQ